MGESCVFVVCFLGVGIGVGWECLRILAIVLWPYYIGAKQSGFKALGDSKDLNIPGASSTLAVNRGWVKDNTKRVEGFLKALIEATALTNSDHDKTVAAIASHLR